MRRALILLALPLAACSRGPDPDALQRQFDMMAQNGASPDELCNKSRQIADAWLAREDQAEYQTADLDARLRCNHALIQREW